MGRPAPSRLVRFGLFEADLQSGDLRKSGIRIHIQDQPFQVLAALLECPGKAVTREELRQRLWPEDTFVDFDHSLNTAINKLRETLGDSADSPRFIETLPRRGYRFIAPVERIGEEIVEPEPAPTPPPGPRRWLRWLAVAAIVLAVAAGVGGIFFRPQQKELRIVPFTTSLGYEGEPAISPNGELVAFVKRRDIYVQAVGSDTPLQRTDTPESESSPAWSPDSREIAFCREGKAGFTIHVMEALTGPERNLGESTGCALAWSPNEDFLAVAVGSGFRAEGPGGIYSLSVGTRETRTLTSPPPGYRDGKPAFSPDGRTLAFPRWRDFWAPDIYLLPLGPDGAPAGEPKRLTSGGGPAWAADGRSIVFVGRQQRDLWRIPVSGGEPERLNVGDNLRHPSISWQGNRLVCGKTINYLNIYRVPGPNATGAASADKGGSPKLLISSTATDDFPSYSPDGEKIVFVSTRSGLSQIWVCDSDGSNEVRLTDVRGGFPSWSPDGRRVAFMSDYEEPGNSDIYVVSAEGGQPRRLTVDDRSDWQPNWSQDGKWIYFGSSRTGDWQIWRIPSEGGTAEQVTRDGGSRARESADGRFLYYTKPGPTRGIWRMPVAGGEETKVLDLDQREQWDLLKDGICYTGGRRAIKFLRFASGQIELVTELPEATGNNRGFAVSPDGRWILYTQVERYEVDLILVENFQ